MRHQGMTFAPHPTKETDSHANYLIALFLYLSPTNPNSSPYAKTKIEQSGSKLYVKMVSRSSNGLFLKTVPLNIERARFNAPLFFLHNQRNKLSSQNLSRIRKHIAKTVANSTIHQVKPKPWARKTHAKLVM